MSTHNIDAIWNDFARGFSYAEKEFDTVIGCCKQYNIDPALFANNLFYLTGQRVSPEQVITAPTGSLIELLEYRPPAYPVTFVAAFPDVVEWFMIMNNDDNQKHSNNTYFLELKNNQSKYLDNEMKLNSKFLLLLITAFIESNGSDQFECSF